MLVIVSASLSVKYKTGMCYRKSLLKEESYLGSACLKKPSKADVGVGKGGGVN